MEHCGIKTNQGGLRAGGLCEPFDVGCPALAKDDLDSVDPRRRENNHNWPGLLDEAVGCARTDAGSLQAFRHLAARWVDHLGIVSEAIAVDERERIGKSFLCDGGRGRIRGRR